MADDLYALSEDDVRLLRNIAQLYKRGELTRNRQPLHRSLPEAMHHYAAYTTTEGIPAMDDDIAGQADVFLATVSTSGLLAATTVSVRAYNMSSYAVNDETWIQLKREQLTGRLVVDFENCT